MNETLQARELTRREIAVYGRALMLSSRVIELCESEATPRQEQFLHRVLSEEIVRRDRSRKTRLLNRAGFPVLKGFDEYEFAEVRFPPAFSREQLLDLLWGDAGAIEPRTIDVHVHRLRKELERDELNPTLIVTVRGVGYRFDPEG